MLTPAADTRAADWIVASLTTFAVDVNSLVPAGFEAYVRVFHPAGTTTWHEIAARCGTTAHAGMQLHALTGTWEGYHHGLPGLYDQPPEEGSLPNAQALEDVLRRHTRAPARCWFAVWEGYGALGDDVRMAPLFAVPNRRYHLLRGESGSANIWWPDDRAWCVATEIDLSTTYVGCSRPCADELVGAPGLEALEIDPRTGIGHASDEVNPAPPRRG